VRIVGLLLLIALASGAQEVYRPAIPRTWDESTLREWATPLAGLGERPSHFSEEEYYAAPVDNLRTYAVYYPGREPSDYWEFLNTVGPQPLIEPEKLKSKADWVEAGREVFHQHDMIGVRLLDPAVIARARDPSVYEEAEYEPRSDGTVPDLRWVPTEDGVALGSKNCASCHQRVMPDGSILDGAPVNERGSPLVADLTASGVSPVPLAPGPLSLQFWRAFRVPWIENDIHDAIKSMNAAELFATIGPGLQVGLFPRWNSSSYFTTKIPDLIGFRGLKYIDHTATHKHRGPGDVMRYAALVTSAESFKFGRHSVMEKDHPQVGARLSDAALYALAMYLYSLEPPPNPNPYDDRAAAGKALFQRQGCPGCHTPPLYTSNKLTLAQGFDPPKEHLELLDILPISVGTDPGGALKTRKGTGYYKVPSLRGVWYRGHLLHDGSLTTLEEMFDPVRLTDGFVRSGFRPAGREGQAVRGHEFGLALSALERTQLIAFLRTL